LVLGMRLLHALRPGWRDAANAEYHYLSRSAPHQLSPDTQGSACSVVSLTPGRHKPAGSAWPDLATVNPAPHPTDRPPGPSPRAWRPPGGDGFQRSNHRCQRWGSPCCRKRFRLVFRGCRSAREYRRFVPRTTGFAQWRTPPARWNRCILDILKAGSLRARFSKRACSASPLRCTQRDIGSELGCHRRIASSSGAVPDDERPARCGCRPSVSKRRSAYKTRRIPDRLTVCFTVALYASTSTKSEHFGNKGAAGIPQSRNFSM